MGVFVIDNSIELNAISMFLKRKNVDMYMNTMYISVNSIKECILGYMISNGMNNNSFLNAYNNTDLKLYALTDVAHIYSVKTKEEDASREIENILSHIQFIIEPSIYDKLDRYILYHLDKSSEFRKIKVFKNGITIISMF